MEKRDEVFYVNVRPSIKKALKRRMEKDGFKSMADWFEQWVNKNLGK